MPSAKEPLRKIRNTINNENTELYQYLFTYFTDWFGLIFLRSGYYAGAVFRFHIFIGKSFPQIDVPVRHICLT